MIDGTKAHVTSTTKPKSQVAEADFELTDTRPGVFATRLVWLKHDDDVRAEAMIPPPPENAPPPQLTEADLTMLPTPGEQQTGQKRTGQLAEVHGASPAKPAPPTRPWVPPERGAVAFW